MAKVYGVSLSGYAPDLYGNIHLEDSQEYRGVKCYKMTDCHTFDKDGQPLHWYGDSYVKEGEWFDTFEELKAYVTEKSNKRIFLLKASIKDLRDLLEFPLKYFGGDDVIDPEARTAYVERAKELCGVEIRDV